MRVVLPAGVLLLLVGCTDLGGLSSGGTSGDAAPPTDATNGGDAGGDAGGGSIDAAPPRPSTPGVKCGTSQCTSPSACCNFGSSLICQLQGCGGGPRVECDEAGDCAGGLCCAKVDTSVGPALLSTFCAGACDNQVCAVNGDCPGGQVCKPLAGVTGPTTNVCSP